MPPPSYRAILRRRPIANLLLAAALARLAERILGLVLILYALQRFQSPQLAGWVAFATMAPGLLVSPLAGALLDRINPAAAITLDLAFSAGWIAVLASLCLERHDGVGSLLTLTVLYSLTTPLSVAGVRTLLPRLVPAGILGRANALDTTIHAAVDVCGPALAGVLFAFAGAAAALFMVAALSAAACVVLLPAARREPFTRPGVHRGLLADAMDGVTYVLRHPSLRTLACAYGLYQIGWGILLVAVPLFVAGAIGGDARGDVMVGAIWAVSGVASAAGALLVGRFSVPNQERTLLALGMLLSAPAIYPIGAWFGLPGLCLGLTLLGFLAGPIDVGVLTLRQRRTGQGWLGRVMAVSISLNLSGAPIGSALGGILLTWSLHAAFAVAAFACAAGALAAVWLPRR